MSGIDYIVPPMSWAKIGRLTDDLRNQFGLANEPYFPIVDFIELVLDARLSWVTLLIATTQEMDGAEGLTDPAGTRIILREDVYTGACRGNGRARFTAAHELGHWVMHTKLPMARATFSIEAFRRSEPQANQFAAELLMPRDFICAEDTPGDIASRHGVSLDAATTRLNYLNEKGLLK